MPSLPATRLTQHPEKNKVVANPVFDPINKQAALVIRPNRDWSCAPMPPEKLPNPFEDAMKRLQAQLKTERNAHACTRDQLGEVRIRMKHLMEQNRELKDNISNLRTEIENQQQIIQQLEDLKL